MDAAGRRAAQMPRERVVFCGNLFGAAGMSPPGGGVDPGSQVCGTKRLEEEESVRVSVSCEWFVRTAVCIFACGVNGFGFGG